MLQQSLDRIKERIEGRMPSEFVKIMHESTQKLEDSGIGEKILKQGDKAPNFELLNQNGEIISSEQLLLKGPLVLTFYRGVWCPYCNTDLAYLNKYKDILESKGATLLGLSPQKPEYNKQVVEGQKLNYDLLTDVENNTASAFGLRWEMIDPLKSLYANNFGISLPAYNGDESWTLPVPSRFIIEQDGFIRYAEYSVDYTKRPDPNILVDHLNFA